MAVPTEMLELGTQFKDSDEFLIFIDHYQRRTHQQFIVNKSDYRKDKEGKTIERQYDRVTLVCHRGKQQDKKNPTGARPFQQTFKNDCPVKVKLSYHKRTSSLHIVSVDLQHNHELTSENFALLPLQRRLNEDEKAKARELLALGTDAAAVRQAMIVATRKKVQPKDIHNIRTAATTQKRAGRSNLQVLQGVIKPARETEKGLIVKSSSDPKTHELNVIIFVTEEMRNSNTR